MIHRLYNGSVKTCIYQTIVMNCELVEIHTCSTNLACKHAWLQVLSDFSITPTARNICDFTPFYYPIPGSTFMPELKFVTLLISDHDLWANSECKTHCTLEYCCLQQHYSCNKQRTSVYTLLKKKPQQTHPTKMWTNKLK